MPGACLPPFVPVLFGPAPIAKRPEVRLKERALLDVRRRREVIRYTGFPFARLIWVVRHRSLMRDLADRIPRWQNETGDNVDLAPATRSI